MPVNRAAALACASKENNEDDMAAVFDQLETEQEEWEEEILDDGVIEMLHRTFENLVIETDLDDWL